MLCKHNTDLGTSWVLDQLSHELSRRTNISSLTCYGDRLSVHVVLYNTSAIGEQGCCPVRVARVLSNSIGRCCCRLVSICCSYLYGVVLTSVGTCMFSGFTIAVTASNS